MSIEGHSCGPRPCEDCGEVHGCICGNDCTTDSRPEVWGGCCECWVVPEHLWTTHYGAVEPGSMVEYNPECPEHGEGDDQ